MVPVPQQLHSPLLPWQFFTVQRSSATNTKLCNSLFQGIVSMNLSLPGIGQHRLFSQPDLVRYTSIFEGLGLKKRFVMFLLHVR
jgi:hypothetical protein